MHKNNALLKKWCHPHTILWCHLPVQFWHQKWCQFRHHHVGVTFDTNASVTKSSVSQC